MSNDSMKIHIEGQVYDLDDFELGEMEWLEDELGGLGKERLKSMKAAVRFVTLIRRRTDPEFTIDQARKMKLTIFDDPAEAEPKPGAKRPTRAARGKSTRAASGASS